MLNVGAVVVAIGFDPFNSSTLTQYGYGKYKNVLSALEYERLICASGPTGGHLKRPLDEKPIRKIAFIQCIGSRDLNNNSYCSTVCCMHATKEAILAYEHDQNVNSYVFYMDLRAAGKGFQKYVDRAKKEYKTSYIRGRVAKISADEHGDPIIIYENTETSQPMEKKVDLAVLATSFVPRKSLKGLSEVLNIGINEYGFIDTNSLAPLDSTRPGIFICGCCREPADIPDCVSQASGAAARVAEVLRG
jgi:heterodisulfide reductase subunit A